MTADVQSWSTEGKAGNENDLSSCVGDGASSFKNQEPHTQAETAQKTANSFRNIFEQERNASGYQASKTSSHQIAALGGVGDWRMHHKYDEYSDGQGENVSS